MRKIDLHCYPGTAPWIASQGPYVEARATYWNRPWVAKDEAAVAAELESLDMEAVLVAFDIESVTHTPPCSNAYVAQLRDRYPRSFIGAWGAVDPLKGEQAIRDAEEAVKVHGVIGFHFHPIMGHFSVDDPELRPLFETISSLGVPVMVDVGTTGMGAGMPGGMGARIRHAHPLALDELAANFPEMTIIAAHPGWPWIDEMTAIALRKGNVFLVAVLTVIAFGAFIAPLDREFGWGVPAIALGASILSIMIMIVSPLQGLLVDRFGGRRLVLSSIPVFGLSLMAMYFLPNSLPVFYVAWVLIPLCGLGVWPVSYLRLTAGWFEHRLGSRSGSPTPASGSAQ